MFSCQVFELFSRNEFTQLFCFKHKYYSLETLSTRASFLLSALRRHSSIFSAENFPRTTQYKTHENISVMCYGLTSSLPSSDAIENRVTDITSREHVRGEYVMEVASCDVRAFLHTDAADSPPVDERDNPPMTWGAPATMYPSLPRPKFSGWTRDRHTCVTLPVLEIHEEVHKVQMMAACGSRQS